MFNNIDAELTVPYRIHQIQKSWKMRITKGGCLLFQGSLDMIIKYRNEGILNLKKHHEDVEQQEDVHQEWGSSPDSQHQTRMLNSTSCFGEYFIRCLLEAAVILHDD